MIARCDCLSAQHQTAGAGTYVADSILDCSLSYGTAIRVEGCSPTPARTKATSSTRCSCLKRTISKSSAAQPMLLYVLKWTVIVRGSSYVRSSFMSTSCHLNCRSAYVTFNRIPIASSDVIVPWYVHWQFDRLAISSLALERPFGVVPRCISLRSYQRRRTCSCLVPKYVFVLDRPCNRFVIELISMGF